MMKRLQAFKVPMLVALFLILVATVIVYADSSSSPTTIKYGTIVLGSADPDGDGLTGDATTGVLQMRNTGGTLVEFTIAELEALATATDEAILFGNGSIWGVDATNFNWDNAANSQIFEIGAGTAPGNMRYLEGSAGGTNYVDVLAAAALSTNPVFTWPEVTYTGLTALPAAGAGQFQVVSTAGVISTLPAERVLYSGLSISANHIGTTTAETVVMPATEKGTAQTDIADINLAAASILDWDCTVTADADTPGDETLTVKVYFGAQEIATSGAIDIDAPTEFLLSGRVKIRINGASGAGYYSFTSFESDTPAFTSNQDVFTSFDTTATQAFSVKLDWGGTTAAADIANVQDVNLTVNNVD